MTATVTVTFGVIRGYKEYCKTYKRSISKN